MYKGILGHLCINITLPIRLAIKCLLYQPAVFRHFAVCYFNLKLVTNRKGGYRLEILKVENAGFKYQATNGEIEAFKAINISVNEGQFVSIVGPSGCGKSTLLSAVAGLLPGITGEMFIKGERVSGISPHIGYMLQRDSLLEWRTIYKNVLLGLELRGEVNDLTTERAMNLLRTYGLYDFRNKYPRQLSGGMRQRAALIRTLATGPDILLLDEAFSALDYQTRLTVTDDVYKILKGQGVTMIMITHDIPESIAMSDSVIILTQRPAQIKEVLKITFENAKTPLERRSDEKFTKYFDHIWKELRHNDENTQTHEGL